LHLALFLIRFVYFCFMTSVGNYDLKLGDRLDLSTIYAQIYFYDFF
jgi:hypothetical protein